MNSRVFADMSGSGIARRVIHYLQKLKATNIPSDLIEKGQNRVIDASLTLIRERAKLKVYNHATTSFFPLIL